MIGNAIYLPHRRQVVYRLRPLGPVTVVVGCDPEAEIFRPDGMATPAWCHIRDLRLSCQVGRDGAGFAAEFRPAPGSPEGVIRNLRSLLRRFRNRFPWARLSTRGDIYPIGGHIHISIWKDERIVDMTTEEIGVIIAAIDSVMGTPSIAASGFARDEYAKRCNWRRYNPNGTDAHFEYRTPPARIFANPALAEVSLRIARWITWKLVSTGEFNPDELDVANIASDPEQVEAWRKFAAFGLAKGADDILVAWGVETNPEGRASHWEKYRHNWPIWDPIDDDTNGLVEDIVPPLPVLEEAQ